MSYSDTLGLQARLKARAGMDPIPKTVDRELTIGEVAHRSGVAASAIRYYESLGLIPPPPRVHGERRYTDEVLGSLAFIAVAQAAGFALREIEELVAHVTRGPGMAEAMQVMSEQKLAEVDEAITQAQARKDWLELARDCGCSNPDECALFPTHDELQDNGRAPLQLLQPDGTGCRRDPV
jgi:MerR family redox-sensitive transcriptional activator SoxR